MRKNVLRSIKPLAVFIITISIVSLTVILIQQRGSAQSQGVKQTKQKKLKEIAEERDVEVEGADGSHPEELTLESLGEASAIVYGRITDTRSFFDESSPVEYGENITTEYTVDVLRVLKDTTLSIIPAPGKALPAPLSTPLKIARNGGEVKVNGHRASIKVKGFESLNSGKDYVFFLYWSPDYGAYVLAHGISGVVMVNDDLSLKPLSSSIDIQAKLRGMDLESFLNQLK